MNFGTIQRRIGTAALILAAAGAAGVWTSGAWAQGATTAAAPSLTAADVGRQAWTTARSGDVAGALSTLRTASVVDDPMLAQLRASVATLDQQFAKREQMRAERIGKVTAKLDELLQDGMTASISSRALRFAVEWHMLSPEAQKDEILKTERIVKLRRIAEENARAAESKGDWLMAAELFGRLNLLFEKEGAFKKDAKRLNDRLGMIRLYVPKRLFDLRNERREAEGLPKQTTYNPARDDFNDRLRGITMPMVLAALRPASQVHVERTSMRSLLIGGLESVRTMVTTHDLEAVFPGFADPDARRVLLTFVDEQLATLTAEQGVVSDFAASRLLTQLLEANRSSVKVPDSAVLHEFGNGAFSMLDDFSQLVWPDEVERFRRMTQGSFVGVGVQIQMDEERQLIKVITPLENGSARVAGVQSGDYIKKINDVSAEGLSLDQAVELITGQERTNVTIVFERDGKDIPFTLERKRLPIYTARGWTRTGPKDTDWNWYIDPENKIGYIRLSGFNKSRETSSAEEVKGAIAQMQRDGAQGLIFDLRFNPGGLMDQAVDIVNLFVDSGTIVYTERAGGVREQTENARPGRAIAESMPMVVMINDNSASASEIVSGALKYYADQGRINAIILGDRSFGKGSVQNVLSLPPNQSAEMRLTTQYYFLPNGRLVHRRPGAQDWGVIPHITVEMLPQQISDAVALRQEADLPAGASRARPKKEAPNPENLEEPSTVLDGPIDAQRLLTEGIDLQLKTALVLLQSQVTGTKATAANKPGAAGGPG